MHFFAYFIEHPHPFLWPWGRFWGNDWGIRFYSLAYLAGFYVLFVGLRWQAQKGWSLLRGEKAAQENPWRATTLEWSIPSPSPLENFAAYEPVIYRAAYEFKVTSEAEDFTLQHLPPTCGQPTPSTAQETGLAGGNLVDGLQGGAA